MPDAVISIASHVARGGVGNRAMVFALERFGIETWAVPTIVLAHHPGHGPVERIVPEPESFAKLLHGLVEGGRATEVVGIVSGYLASPEQAHAVAALVEAVKNGRRNALYLCDPVIGDAGGLYVAPALADAIRDHLLPLADIATPNAFECAWLALGKAARNEAEPDLAALARALPPPVMLVTSAPAMMRRHVGNLLVTERDAILFEHALVKTAAKGTGDLLAALFFARRLMGQSLPKAAELALAGVYEIVAGTAKAGADELMLAALQDSIVAPQTSIVARRLGPMMQRPQARRW